jgi:DNA-dependent RNA polymerase auxiliary subunit epsilon
MASEATNRMFAEITISTFSRSNARDSIRFNCEFDSNVIDESELQYEKQDELRISTFRGIMIDLSDDDENANDSIRFNCEFDSNVIDESDSQYEKHFEQSISTSFRITID